MPSGANLHLGTDEGRFSLVIGFRLRLRRHAKDTCDFLIPHLHQWGTSGRYPMPFLAFTGAVVCSSKKIGEPYFCYYRLLPQVARTYLCTRNLSDSPFLEKGGHDHTSSVHAVAPSRWKPKIDGSPIPPRRTWRFQKCCRSVSSLRTNRGNVSNGSGSEAIS